MTCDRAACSGSRTSSNQGALSAGLSALAQPFKLRMARAPHETQLWDYSTNVVLIEPLASLQAVEDFLWPRVFRSNPPPEARGGANAAAVAAQAAAAARKSSRSTRSKSGKAEEQVSIEMHCLPIQQRCCACCALWPKELFQPACQTVLCLLVYGCLTIKAMTWCHTKPGAIVTQSCNVL